MHIGMKDGERRRKTAYPESVDGQYESVTNEKLVTAANVRAVLEQVHVGFEELAGARDTYGLVNDSDFPTCKKATRTRA